MIRVITEDGVWVDLAGKPFSAWGEWAWVGRVDEFDPVEDRERKESIRRALAMARAAGRARA